MPGIEVRLDLTLDAEDGDRERIDDEMLYLLDELSKTDVASIERVKTGMAPTGTKSGDAVEVGALLIALGSSGATLPVLIGLVQDWLKRRGSGTVRLKIGSDELELTHVSIEQQQQVLDRFLSHHQG
jgi:hypothetical protein